MKTKKSKSIIALFLAVLMLVTSIPFAAFATDELGVKPSDEKTSNHQPFEKDNPSEMYRIPCMVTLNDGTIVAVADARWSSGMDGGGNDTIVSRSTDNGLNWEYSMVNYYPDNGNEFNKASTSVCDSELVTDGTNVYMLTTFFPAGYALNKDSANNVVSAGTIAFDDQGRLKLKKDGDGSAFNYYLGEFQADGYARIYANSNNLEVSGYTVDHDYYIYDSAGAKSGNLFYSDAVFQTEKVNFLLFRKSADGGKTWSDFSLVNLKKTDEAFFGVGPGRGVYDPDLKRLIFSTYSWNGSENSQRSSFIYYDLNTGVWTRSGNFPNLSGVLSGNWSSENQIVLLNNHTLRCFVRNAWMHLIYADATLNEDGSYSWSDFHDIKYNANGTPNFVLGMQTNSNSGCQLSVLKYSEKLQYNGGYYDAVFVSTPQKERHGGVIYTLLIDKNNNIVNVNSSNSSNDKQIEYRINSDGIYYGYSCLTELKDGRIGVLYEINDCKDLQYDTYDPTILSNCRLPDYVGKTYVIDLAKGDTRTYFVDTNRVEEFDTDTLEKNPGYIQKKFTQRDGVQIQLGADKDYTGEMLPGKNALYEFKKNSDGKTWTIYSQGVYLTVAQPGVPSTARPGSIEIMQDGEYFQFVADHNRALYYYRDISNAKVNQFDRTTAYGLDGSTDNADQENCKFEIYRPLEAGEEDATSNIPGYMRIKSLNEIKNNGQYLIACQRTDGQFFVLYPSTSTNNTYSHSAKVVGAADGGFFMTVFAEFKGSTTIVAGKDTYIFNVSDYSNEILGVVDYDPVIYTHGTDAANKDMDHTKLGPTIADGTWEGEKETHFRIRPAAQGEYSVVSIRALSAPDDKGQVNAIDGADISFTYNADSNDGMLSGVLPLCSSNDGTKNYTHYDEGEYVTLKTTVEDKAGNQYIQTDRLYVTSNPVAGHIAFGLSTRHSNGWVANWMTYTLANNSYGNTNIVGSEASSAFGTDYKYNALHIYNKYFNGGNTKNKDVDILVFGRNPEKPEDKQYSIHSIEQVDDNAKRAGVLDYGDYNKIAGGKTSALLAASENVSADTTPVAYYFYDLSLPQNKGNEGIVNPTLKLDGNNNPIGAKFNVQMSRMACDVLDQAGTNWIVDYGNGSDVNGKNFSKDSAIKEINKSLPDGTTASITQQNDMFGAGGEAIERTNYNSRQKTVNVDCEINNLAAGNKASLKGLMTYAEYAYGYDGKDIFGKDKIYGQSRTVLNLPFEIKFCNKSAERNAYEDTIKTVLKSTDYTASTWKQYMDSVLVYQEYLNNFTLLTTDDTDDNGVKYADKIDNVKNVDGNYNSIQKAATFPVLKEQIDADEELYNNGIIFGDGSYYTPDTYTSFENAYDDAVGFYDEQGKNVDIIFGNKFYPQYPQDAKDDPDVLEEVMRKYGGDGIRSETPGWDVGPYSEKKLPVQEAIEEKTDTLKSTRPELAADDSAYIAAKEEFGKIDKTAFDDGADSIQGEFNTGDNGIYKAYKGRDLVNITQSNQDALDDYTRAALEEMTVACEKAEGKDNLKKYHITVNYIDENGVSSTGYNKYHPYGYTYDLDLSAFANLDDFVVKCIVSFDDDNGNANDSPIKIEEYESTGYIVPVVVNRDITINVAKYNKSDKQVVVKDYYGVVIDVLYGDEVKVDSVNGTITVGAETVKYVPSPKYQFAGWSIADNTYPIDKAMEISQVGNLNKNVGIIEAVNDGTVNAKKQFIANHVDLKMTLESPTAQYWTRTINGVESLASYEQKFVNFSAGEDVTYTPYASLDALPENLQANAAKGIPTVHGAGYFVNGKFTLSIDYSAKNVEGFDVTVVDTGIVYATDIDGIKFEKGEKGVTTIVANNISHWSDDRYSGTYTLTKKNSNTGIHYMRAYVSYTATYNGYTLPYVVYSDTIYKCENGVVTAVNN